MSQKKKSKKKPSVLTNFHFLVNFIRHTGPMVTMVTRYTGGLSISKWAGEKNPRIVFLSTFIFWLRLPVHGWLGSAKFASKLNLKMNTPENSGFEWKNLYFQYQWPKRNSFQGYSSLNSILMQILHSLTGDLSQLPVVQISRREKFKKKTNVLSSDQFSKCFRHSNPNLSTLQCSIFKL